MLFFRTANTRQPGEFFNRLPIPNHFCSKRLPMKETLALAISAFSLSFVLGCSGGSDDLPDDLVPVSGVVTVDGQPVPNARVEFTPVGKGGGSFGDTNAEGRYTLYFGARGNGALKGSHRVAIMVGEGEPEEEADSDEEASATAVFVEIPPKYLDGSTPLTAEVGDGEDIDFELTAD